jgi:hypothetical protein
MKVRTLIAAGAAVAFLGTGSSKTHAGTRTAVTIKYPT